MYTPGKGSGVVASVVSGGSVAVVATELPKTGISAVNELAIAVLAGLAAWAVAYKLLNRSA